MNGLFAVPKKDKQRLILDARRANLHFIACPEVVLPNPGSLGELSMSGETLAVGKNDLDSFYHRIEIPRWMRTYFGLPAIARGEEKEWPVFRVLPMGWSHSVYVGQQIHERIIERTSLQAEHAILPDKSMVIGEIRHGVYIDDLFVMGSNTERVRNGILEAVAECRTAGFPISEPKLELPPKEMVEVLGIEIGNDGLLLPKRDKMSQLLKKTEEFISTPKWGKKGLEEILGKWVWFLLLRRPLLSILKASYEMLHAEPYVPIPAYAVRSEFRTLTNVFPLIYGNIGRNFADKIMCIDASLSGAGVVYAEANNNDYLGILRGEDIGEWAKRRAWKTAIKHRWRKKQHINVLEGKGITSGHKMVLTEPG